jgi:integrase
MASVHRRPGSKYWHAAWRDSDGQLNLRSTKHTDRSNAMTCALAFERASRMGGAGDFAEAQARKILNDILEATGSRESLRCPTTVEWLNQWLAGKQTTKSEATGERYRGVVEGFAEHLSDRGRRPLTSLAPGDVQDFITKRLKAGCSPTTVNLDVKILRIALNLARRHGLVATNVAEAVELPEKESVERGTFSPEEVQMLVCAAEGEWRTLVLLGYFTGLRLSDCCNLSWSAVDLVGRFLRTKVRKTGTEVTIPIHPDLQAHLESLATSDKAEVFVLPHSAGLKPGGRHGLSEGFKRIVRRAGLDLMTVKGGGKRQQSKRTFHALRHSFVSALANADVAPELRMKLSGHSSASVHKGYSHLELETLRKAVDKLPSLDKLPKARK